MGEIHVFRAGRVGSALDFARDLISRGRLAIWDGVLVESQSAGRGQARKKWLSPPGNLYGALRLPTTPPFDTGAASVIVGAYCVKTLREAGFPVFLKWPNDLILAYDGGYGKTGGILLEERDGGLVVGIGINITSAPENLAENPYMQAVKLADVKGDSPLNIDEIWIRLVKNLRDEYKCERANNWPRLVDDFLLWRNENVVFRDGDEETRGVFRGVDSRGEAILETRNGEQRFYNGVMRPEK